MSRGKYLFTREDGTVFFKLAGTLKYTESLSFDEFIDKLIREDSFHEAIIDLTEVEYIDSTNLGIIAKLGEHLLNAHSKRTTIISTNEDVNEVLRSVGFDEVFILIDNPSSFTGETAEEIPCYEGAVDKRTGRMILEAHQSLIKINKKNREAYQDIVDLLEKELDSD
jgi:anti-anti-sigma factor